jgi:hypothetical protein
MTDEEVQKLYVIAESIRLMAAQNDTHLILRAISEITEREKEWLPLSR